jgi:hypothetical protein
MFKLPHNFYSPDDSPGSNGEATLDDTFDILFNEDNEDEKPLDLDSKSPPKEKVEESDEKDEEEDKVEMTEEEVAVHAPPRKKEILEEFPELFKKFPTIEASIYRDKQFTEVFPTPADARESLEKSNAFDRVYDRLMNGSVQDVLSGVKEDNPEAFKASVDNLLVDLHSVDKEAYYHVIGNVAQDFILRMVSTAKSQNNEALGVAAQILNQFIFGTDEFVPQQRLAKQIQRDDEVVREREELNRTKFNDAIDDVVTKTDNQLMRTIDAYIDPKGALTDYVKKIASKKVFDELEQVIGQDKAFKAVINSMWKRVIDSNYEQSGRDKIRSAYLSKAKTLLPKLLTKARNEAYKGMGRNVKSSDNKGLVPAGKSATQTSGKINHKEAAAKIPQGMSSAEYLMSDD